MLFRFHDDKSRRQIDKANNHRNDTKQYNADNLVRYQQKVARLHGSRNEWELADSIVS